MALTPDQQLARLTKALDDRSQRLSTLRAYMDGNAPLPEGVIGWREAYQNFQRQSRTNFGELVVDAVVEGMIPSGFTLGKENQDNDRLREIWTRNRLQIGSADVLRNMVGLSHGYMIVGEDPKEARKALITCERPEQVITEQSASRPDQVRSALKVYRDTVDGYDMAFLHLPGEVFTYYRPLRDSVGTPMLMPKAQGAWKFAGSESTGLDFIPVFPFINRGGLGEFESHLDVLNRINWNILQRLVITAMQAYRQRAVKGDLPDVDEENNEIDYADVFKPGAGNLWRLPDGVELWESQPTDITAILTANKDDITHLAAVTRTPMATLMPEGANQSAEGANFAREGLVKKTEDRVERAKGALSLVMGAALAIENGSSKIVDGIESLFIPVKSQSLAERADAASKLAPILPWRTIATDVLGYSADRVDQMETERATDALMTSLALPLSAPATNAIATS